MFTGIGDLLKGLNLKNIDIPSIADKIIGLVPDGKGKAAMSLALGVAKKGGSPKDVKQALENMLPAEDKQKLQGIDVWKNLPDDKDSIVPYGMNVAKHFQILKD